MKDQKTTFLGEHPLHKKSFSRLDSSFKKFHRGEFSSLTERERNEEVNRELLNLVKDHPEPCFLLAPVLEFIQRVEKEGVLEHYTLSSFELWLNQHSGLNFEENYQIRSKIVGKRVDRTDYEALFPIGMGKVYKGTHFVTAHKSPDLDTTVASFWGWIDAFGARVSDGLHVWNLPGGPPSSQIEIEWIFRDLFGEALFTHAAQSRPLLTLHGRDLISQKDLLFKSPLDSIGSIDHEREQYPVVVVDEQGFYLGDWRGLDVESVRQIIILLSSCLRWFENQLHLSFISIFLKKEPRFTEVVPILETLFCLKLEESEPALEFTSKQKEQIQYFTTLVLKISKGLAATFDEMCISLAQFSGASFNDLKTLLPMIKKLFDSKGKLIEERSDIFGFMEKAVGGLHQTLFAIRQRLELLDIALKTKQDVFKHQPTTVTLRSDIEEVKAKMGAHFSLTVTQTDKQGKLFPNINAAEDFLDKPF